MMRRNKIVLVGSGQIGSSLGMLAAVKELGDVVFYDIVEGLPMGKALDLNHLSAIENVDVNFSGVNSYEGIHGADVIIITAGIARKPGMSRDDLLSVNKKIISDVAKAVKDYAPDAFCIVVTNPLDVMVGIFQEISGLPYNKVCGMAGVLDGGRFKYLLANKLNVSVEDIHATILGGHGQTMIPLLRYTTVGGINIPELIKMNLITQEEIDHICDNVTNGGAEIVSLLKTGSAFCAPASAAISMAESYLKDKKRLMQCAVYLDGHYGVHGVYVGAPCIIGRGGVEKILELNLNENETSLFKKSVQSVIDLNAVSAQLKLKNNTNIENLTKQSTPTFVDTKHTKHVPPLTRSFATKQALFRFILRRKFWI